VKVAVVALISNLFFSILLMGPLRHGGIALALSISSSIQLVLLLFLLNKKISLRGLKGVLIGLMKSAVASVVMGFCVHFVHIRWFRVDPSSGLAGMVFQMAFLVFSGILIYFLFARLLGCREHTAIMDMFRPVFK
jgi:putative peptidoglycan lipid II flippase